MSWYDFGQTIFFSHSLENTFQKPGTENSVVHTFYSCRQLLNEQLQDNDKYSNRTLGQTL